MLVLFFVKTTLIGSAIVLAILETLKKRKTKENNQAIFSSDDKWLERVLAIELLASNRKYNYRSNYSYYKSSNKSDGFNQDEEDFLMGHGVYTGINIAESQFQEQSNTDNMNFTDHHNDTHNQF